MPNADRAEYTRDTTYLDARITADGRRRLPGASRGGTGWWWRAPAPGPTGRSSCAACSGWSRCCSMGVCGPTHDERSWTFDLDPGGRDPVLGIERLQEAYLRRVPGYDRGITVPAIVDIPTGAVVTNDFAQITLDLSIGVDGPPPRRRARPVPGALRDEIDEVGRARLPGREQRRLPLRVRQLPARPTSRRTAGCSTALDGWRSGWPRAATWSATRSPRPTCACSPPWSASTPSITATSSATGASSPSRRRCGPTPATCSRRPASATRSTSATSSSTTTRCTRTINPTGIVPLGPDLSGWLAPHGREALGGRPFGDGTPPPPPVAAERVPAAHTVIAADGPVEIA